MEAGWKRAGRGLLGLVYPLRAVCMGCGTAAGCEDDYCQLSSMIPHT